MGQHVAQFSSFMNRSRSFRRAMAPDPARKRELPEELLQALDVQTFLRINLRICTFKICRTKNAWRPVPRTSKKNHVEVVLLDEPVQMNVHERESGARSPVAEQPVLDVLRPQRFQEQRVLLQVDHA